jgi:hypothetical protein
VTIAPFGVPVVGGVDEQRDLAGWHAVRPAAGIVLEERGKVRDAIAPDPLDRREERRRFALDAVEARCRGDVVNPARRGRRARHVGMEHVERDQHPGTAIAHESR